MMERTTQRTHIVSPSAMMLAAAVLGAVGPAVLHLTASGANPFLYNTTIVVVQVLVFSAALLVTARHLLPNHFWQQAVRQITGSNRESASSRWKYLKINLSFYRRRTALVEYDATSTMCRLVTIEQPSWRQPWLLWKAPLLWAIVGTLHYGFLAWSTLYIETAVGAAIYELWPLILAFALARHYQTDDGYRQGPIPTEKTTSAFRAENVVFSILAGVGVLLLLGSEPSRVNELHTTNWSLEVVAGIALALVAAWMQALNVLGTLSFAQILYHRTHDTFDSRMNCPQQESREQKRIETRVSIWLTLLAVVIVRVLNIPVSLLFGLVSNDAGGSITVAGFVGAVVLGCSFGFSALLIRVANITSGNTNVNVLYVVSPIIAIMLLLLLGVTLPRFDFFIIGAALILAANIFVRLKPSEDSDTNRFG